MYTENIPKSLKSFPLYTSVSGTFLTPLRFTEYHLHKEIEIIKILNGKMQVNIMDSPIICDTGDIIIINSNIPHSSRSIHKNTQQLLFQADLSFISVNSEENILPTNLYNFLNTVSKEYYYIPVTNKLNKEISRYLTNIHYEIKEKKHLYETYVKGYLSLFSACLNRNKILTPDYEQIDAKKLNKIMAIVEYIDANYQNPITLSEISSVVHLNESYICRLFRTVTKQTIFKYINHVRITNAENLLAKTQLSITDIALSVGFTNITRFDEVFKRMTGLTPLKYRQQSYIVNF